MLPTQIKSLKIGNAEIKNIDAGILYKLDEVLIGMSTLKLFSISVKDKTMTLIASNNANEANIITENLKQTVKSWKKT